MPRTAHSLAADLSRQHQLGLNNAQYERVAMFIESAEDKEETLKRLQQDRDLVWCIASGDYRPKE